MNNQINQLGPLAMHYLHANDFANAEKVILQILAINANELNALKIYAFILANQSRLLESITALEKAHQIKKNDPEIAFNLGKAFFDTKQWIESIKFYKIFLRLTKPDPLVLMDIGTAHCQAQNPAEAIKYFNDALRYSPNNPVILNNKVAALIDLKHYSEALELSELAVKLDSQSPSAWNNRGNALMKLQRYEVGLEAVTNALKINPNHLEALINYGNAFTQLKQTANALTAYKRVIEIEPQNIENWINLGNAYADLKQFDLALSSYNTAASCNPNHRHLKGSQLHIHSILCLWNDAYQDLIRSLQKQPEPSFSTPFPLLSKIDEPQLHKITAQEYCSDIYPKCNDLGPIIKKPHQKIRLAYFSADFRNHPVATLTAKLFELHNRSEFEIYGFYFGSKTSDVMHLRIKAAFDYFIPCEHLTDIELAKLAREYEIDIAVDLMGHTQYARTGVFAYRAAPIQVNFLGYPGTIGAEYMDYIIADKTIIPDRLADNYSEQIAYIESYQPNDSKKVISNRIFTRSELGLPERGLVFACFNNNYKIMPNIFGCWMDIMSAIPESSLLLSSENTVTKENLIKAASNYGITSQRIIFVERLDLLSDHLARHQIADLFLDTFPYNAHTTASDALWSGLPVLTLAGETFASRVAASLLTAIGLPELITHSEQEYVLRAIELASNPEKLKAIKEKLITNRLTTPLFDVQRYTKNLELAYMEMIQRYRDESKPS